MLVEDGVPVATVARQLGRSREFVHKWHKRFVEHGLDGLHERSRAPLHRPRAVSPTVERHIVRLREEHGWGPRKLLVLLEEQLPDGEVVPSRTTIANVLRRHGLVQKRRRKATHHSLYDNKLTEAAAPNDVWAIDFKGHFKLLNGQYCYPLTVTDSCTRSLLGCFALPGPVLEATQAHVNGLFTELGLPAVIRSDNGNPFASVRALHGLTRLSAGWLAQGIRHERTRPGKPQDNGRHERMHRDLKAFACVRPERTLAEQQLRFDAFVAEFNQVRPHEALNMRRPSELYAPSPRRFEPHPTFSYPAHFEVRKVYPSGEVTFQKTIVPITAALGRQRIAFEHVETDQWLVHYHEHVIATYDERTHTITGILEKRDAYVRVRGQ